MKNSEIVSILKKYESENSPFYETNFSDYLIDINLDEYEGISLSKMNSEEDVINDFIFWKDLNN
jgi:hypothetical protein